jgi:hypothetical protein
LRRAAEIGGAVGQTDLAADIKAANKLQNTQRIGPPFHAFGAY